MFAIIFCLYIPDVLMFRLTARFFAALQVLMVALESSTDLVYRSTGNFTERVFRKSLHSFRVASGNSDFLFELIISGFKAKDGD
jgi:hypothetical protein